MPGCPALAECRAWALSLPPPRYGYDFAVYGGMTVTERRRARRESLKQAG